MRARFPVARFASGEFRPDFLRSGRRIAPHLGDERFDLPRFAESDGDGRAPFRIEDERCVPFALALARIAVAHIGEQDRVLWKRGADLFGSRTSEIELGRDAEVTV